MESLEVDDSPKCQMKNRCGEVHLLVSLAGFDILPVANHRFLVALHVFSNQTPSTLEQSFPASQKYSGSLSFGFTDS